MSANNWVGLEQALGDLARVLQVLFGTQLKPTTAEDDHQQGVHY